MQNARTNVIIVTRTKQEQMSLKFGKTIKTLRLSQNYLVLVKKSVISSFDLQVSRIDSQRLDEAEFPSFHGALSADLH